MCRFSKIDEDYEISGAPEVLCRRSLSLVYSTIDENYPEGTLQLLSDLLQPGYYPPKDITSHLLRGILLDLQSPHHLTVQAFNLLMWTQRLATTQCSCFVFCIQSHPNFLRFEFAFLLSFCRHHRVNKSTVPWDWELLTSVMSNQVIPTNQQNETNFELGSTVCLILPTQNKHNELIKEFFFSCSPFFLLLPSFIFRMAQRSIDVKLCACFWNMLCRL